MIKKILVMSALVIVSLVVYTSQARITGTQPTSADGWCVGAANVEGCFDASGNFIPTVTNNQTLGSSALRWSTIYGTNLNITALSLTNPNFAQIFISTITPYQSSTVYFSSSVTIGNESNAILDINTTGAVGVNTAFVRYKRNGGNQFIAGLGPNTGNNAYEITNGAASSVIFNCQSSGNCGIGQSSATVRFQVTGTAEATNFNTTGSVSASSMSLTGTGGFNNANASSATFTGNGSMGYDQTNKTLAIGDGTNAQMIGPLGAWTAWTPTTTGFSGTPSTTCRYARVGKIIYFHCEITGTSNATGFTFTAPIPTRAGDLAIATGVGVDNNASLTTPVRVDSNGNNQLQLNIYTNWAGAAWTASSGKQAYITGFYEAN